MNFQITDDQESIKASIEKICTRFDARYWLEKDKHGGFPNDFVAALAADGWLGICIPPEYGGSGLGITDAAIMMRAASEGGGGMSAASSVHINVFGLHPVVVFGTPEQKERYLPPIARGEVQACFAVTEPNTGLNTTQPRTRAVRSGDKYVVNGSKVWISTAQVAHKCLLLARTTPLEEVKNPTHGMNPERVPIAAEAVGLGHLALSHAVRYAKDRVVFNRPIGQNQGIQHPLAQNWMELEAAWLMTLQAGWQYDNGKNCAAAANSAKYLAAEAGYNACQRAVMTHGGFGYAKEYHVERFMREGMLPRIAPITPELIMCFIAEKVLGLPRSY